jgi:hypothetical protein
MKLTNNLTNDTLINAYKAQGFDVDQIEVISEGLRQNVDVTVYARKHFTYKQMRALKDGLLLDFDMQPFAKANLSYEQIRNEIEDMIFSGKCTLPTHKINAYLNYLSTIGEF